MAVEVAAEEEQGEAPPEAVEELVLPQAHPPQVEAHQQREPPAGQPLAEVRGDAEAAEEVVAVLLRCLRCLRLPCSSWI